MRVAVVNIRIMRMTVHQWPVLMKMSVRLGPVPGKIMFMPVMRIVYVAMRVRERLVFVLMRVALGQM